MNTFLSNIIIQSLCLSSEVLYKLLILLLLQVLQEKLDSAVDLEMGLREELNKYREENEDLRFQVGSPVWELNSGTVYF